MNKTTMNGPVVMASSGHESVFVSSSSRTHHPELEQLAATMPTATIDASVRSQSRMSISHAKGLLNRPGQNNCFMNSAVQVLWHLDIFRRSFRELQGHACMGDSCIFCALKELFNQFQSSKESALPPDSLRFALAANFSDQRRFQMGFMDDAAECFENILMRIHYHLTNQEVNDAQSPQCQPHCIPHQKFAMNLFEQIACHACGETSEPLVFSQMVHYASTTALCSQAKLFSSDSSSLSFGSLLKLATSMGDIRNCPKMCGTRISSNIRKVLVNRPDVISVGLVWDSEHPTLTLIRSVFQLIETTIQLHEVFDLNCSINVEPRHQLNLVGLVTYYGKHYSTYLYSSQLAEWIYCDDATVRVIGPSWSQVVEKCLKGHFQPLLLLYANPNGTAVNTQHAFSENVPMTAIKKAASSEPTTKECNHTVNNSSALFDQIRKVTSSESYQEQVPDSPSTTSTTSYFSDIGDSTDGYISRKAVESILKIQQHNKKKSEQQELLLGANGMFNKRSNRNSSSSLESFDSTNLRMSSLPRNHTVESQLISSCLLQRRDSGNSSGDRSSSVSSVDTPFYSYRRPLKSCQQTSNKHSDQGYDSFSVSSSDSYPSAATSPSKLTGQKLKQIPEDVHLLEMINASARNECDHLFAEMEILLRKSYDKEREGDLRAAIALADSAASKARIAMDAPYSNHHTLISAKMKYSICVMRSNGLHRRIQEAEAEERRMMKAAHEYHHSRQSSRDSSHGKHSRQGSRDGKDPRVNAISPPRQHQMSPTGPVQQNVEIYATLPKRSKRKSLLKTSNGNLTTEETSCPSFTGDERSTILPKNSILDHLQKEQLRPSAVLPNAKKNISVKCKELPRESDFSDYYSEWEGTKRRLALEKTTLPANNSGWQSCRENDSEVYGEINHTSTARKQCKVKRKLLLGGLLKTKNRSLPDLSRDESLLPENKAVNGSQILSGPANIHRGFPLATVGSRGSTRPSLVKVKPPLIAPEIIPASAARSAQQKECIYENISQLQFASNGGSYARAPAQTPPPGTPSQLQPPVLNQVPLESESLEPKQSTNPFLLELNKKRIEILSKKKANDALQMPTVAKNATASTSTTSGRQNALPMRKLSTREIASFISRTAAASGAGAGCPATSVVNAVVSEMNQRLAQLSVQQQPIPKKNIAAVDSLATATNRTPTILMPIAVHANHNVNANTNTGSRPVKPPDYETAMRRLEMRHNDQRSGSGFPPPPSPLLSAQSTVDQGMPKLVDSAAMSESKSMRRKKKVSFSDHIEWVACADDDPEVHLPNPLLEKVLSNKHVVYTLQ